MTTIDYLTGLLKNAAEDITLNDTESASRRIEAVIGVLNLMNNDIQFFDPAPAPEKLLSREGE